MTAILSSPREQWLQVRRSGIGASEWAAVLGLDPRHGPAAIWASKVGEIEQDEKPWMRWGRRIEGAIAEAYAEETGRIVEDLGAYEIQRHPDIPWLFATLDRVTAGCDRTPAPVCGNDLRVPAECKWVGAQKRSEWDEEPPVPFQVQLQAQMACMVVPWGSLTALLGGFSVVPVWKDLLYHAEFVESALPVLEEFWWRVQRREPPPADALLGTAEAVKRLWSLDHGETIALDAEALELVEQWEKAKSRKSQAESDVTRLDTELRIRLGLPKGEDGPHRTAVFGALPDGSFVTAKLTKRGAYSVEPTEYRTLRRFKPKGLR